ncbi:MAG: hypothetical protein QM635_01420 [Microbacteriaceae bacterium]
MSSAEDRPVTVTTDEVRLRRAPRYGTFIVLGVVLGFLAALVGTVALPVDEAVGAIPMLGYLSCYGVPAGALLGAAVAIVLDRLSARRARTVTAERTTVAETPAPE